MGIGRVSSARALWALAWGLGLALGAAGSAMAIDCQPVQGRMVQAIAGEIGGGTREEIDVGDWRFVFEPAQYGWDIRLYDAQGIDLSAITPPYRGAPNPRELYGWHFRNAENTAANDGSVNAPQDLRLFVFDPALSETGAFDPSAADGFDPEKAPGRGALTILDHGLANLEPGEKARLVYLKFHVCLTWPQSEEVLQETGYGLEDKELFGACGLEPPFALSAFLRPKTIQGDFDGDGAFDVAAPIANLTSGKRAIAICRAGTWLDLIGYDTALGELVPEYLDRIDWWRLEPKGPVGVGAGGPVPPTLAGDAITIGKDDSSSVLVYWDGEGWASYWQGD